MAAPDREKRVNQDRTIISNFDVRGMYAGLQSKKALARKPCKRLILLVPEVGIEPTWGHPRWILIANGHRGALLCRLQSRGPGVNYVHHSYLKVPHSYRTDLSAVKVNRIYFPRFGSEAVIRYCLVPASFSASLFLCVYKHMRSLNAQARMYSELSKYRLNFTAIFVPFNFMSGVFSAGCENNQSSQLVVQIILVFW